LSQTAIPLRLRSLRPEQQLPILLATGAALGLALGLSTLAPQKVAVGLMVVLVLLAAGVFVAVLGVRIGLIGLLIATCMLDRFLYKAGPVDLRAEQVAALLGLAVIGYWILSERAGLNLLRPNLSEALLGLWFLIGLASSVTASLARSRSVKAVALLAISSLGLLLPRRLLNKDTAREDIDTVVKLLLVAFAAEGAYGTGAFLAHVFGSTVGISPNVATGHLSGYGTLWEPNVFGAFCAAGAVLWTWLGRRHFEWLTWLGIALCLGGTVVSFTRAAWATAVVLLAFSLWRTFRRSGQLRQVTMGLAGAAVIAIAVFGAGRAANYYQYQTGPGAPPPPPPAHGLGSLLTNEVDIIGRLYQFTNVFDDLRHRPLLGNGPASYDSRHPIAGQPEQHIANLELAVLNDTGALGFLVFVAFGATIAMSAWRRRRDPTVAGLGLAVVSMTITNTATETTELMITWLMLGLLMMAVDAAELSITPLRKALS
jgi:hypothetical protein